MPASLPVIPGGSLIEKWVNSCSPSSRVNLTLKGLKRPAALVMVPASRPGWKGGVCPEGQAPPSTPCSIVKEAFLVTTSSAEGLLVSAADQGTNLASVS